MGRVQGDAEKQLIELSRLLDVEQDEVVDIVKALLDFNDHNTAVVIHDQIQRKDADNKADSMARALLSDIEASRIMLSTGIYKSDLRLLLSVLRDRVIYRLQKSFEE